MVKNVLRRKLVRDMWHNRMQFLAVILLCALGTWVFTGLDAAWRMLDRTIEQRRRTISKFYEEGTSMPEPLVEGGAAEGGQDEASEAERRLLEALRTRGAADDEVTNPLDDSDFWGGSISPASMGDLLLGEGASRGVRIFIGRVEELVVHN